MLQSLIAYDAAGNVVATLDYLVSRDAAGHAIGLVDFDAHEAAGGEHTDIWTASEATGSKGWPEWLGAQAHEFRVELAGPPGQKTLVALIHKKSGYRRERSAIEAAIAAVQPDGEGRIDLRDVLGGPSRPLPLDENGRTRDKPAKAGAPPPLPLVGKR